MLRHAGITLVELLIVTAMIAVLTLVALPTYRSIMLRSHRADAAAALLNVAAAQERHYTQYHTYASNLEAAPPAGLGLPASTAGGRYAIAIARGDVAGYEVTATAAGAQSLDTHCAAFSLDDTGARTAANEGCWMH